MARRTHAPSASTPSDTVTGWMDANSRVVESWLLWQCGVWQSYLDSLPEWMQQQWQDQVIGLPPPFGGLRGAEQLG